MAFVACRLHACFTNSPTNSTSNCADCVDLFAHVQPQVGGDLLIAAAAGVQLVTDFAGQLDQARFST